VTFTFDPLTLEVFGTSSVM